MAAQSLHRSPAPMGSYLRRLKAKLGSAGATTVTARKIAILFYTLVRQQVEFDNSLWLVSDTERQQRRQRKLVSQARHPGYQLITIQ